MNESSERKLTVAVSGAGGLIGRALVSRLRSEGHTALIMSRRSENLADTEISWDPARGVSDTSKLENSDALIHLAGKSLVGRWSESKKRELVDSRVTATRALVDSLRGMSNPPKALICASAIGFYGDRGADELTEESSAGSGFLADLCRDWESAAKSAGDVCERVVTLRISLVLSRDATAMKKMLLPFRLGLGGRIGNGRQYMSWITREDTVNAILHILKHRSIAGPVNLCAPAPVTNSELTRALGAALNRPTPFAVPAFALRALYGEQADELLLSSVRVLPAKLLRSGFSFSSKNIETAFRQALHL